MLRLVLCYGAFFGREFCMYELTLEVMLAYACAINCAVFFIYGWDKSSSKIKAVRVPEKLLYALTLIAPYGAYFGILAFRHKTQKGIFLSLAKLFMVLQPIIFVVGINGLKGV